MSKTEAPNEKPEDESGESTDRAVEEALDLDFASLEEVKEAFRS
jgi:superoxide dismutase